MWQFSQFPLEYRHKIRILHDGIDTSFFSPAKVEYTEIENIDLSGATEIVTYATRGLEPYRGFPEFYQSLPPVLEARPTCHVIIMGNDDVYYTGKRNDGKGWGEYMRETVPLDIRRVHFMNFGTYERYRKILRISNVHVYLTVPFVLSWSLLEAMSCECLIMASDTDPVKEVIKDGENGLLCTFKNREDISRKIIHALSLESNESNRIKLNGRRAVTEQYSQHRLLPQHADMLYAVRQCR